MPRRLKLLCAAAVVLAGLAVWLTRESRPNVLLVTLDTTRADRIGCYGYAPARTPALDALAARGVLCEHAYTVAPLTLPAHVSLFTGLFPAETGVRTNGRGRLDEALPTLAEFLKRRGYATAAFVASFVLDHKFGVERGFKTYDDEIVGGESGSEALHRARSGAEIVDRALAWLDAARSRPFFCWVHLYDPHAPYLEHPDLFGDEFAERPYDAEIAYVDIQVGRLLEFLKSRGLDDTTLVVVVGDHGEGLEEHVERTHGSTLYDATLHVPLLFCGPGGLRAGGRVESNVSLVDVFPTILDLVGAAPPRRISGRSIKPALIGGAAVESLCYGATDEPFLMDGCSPLRSLTSGRWKYIRTTRPELYDLASDPAERRNLFEADPEKAREMESQMVELESQLAPRAEAQVQLSAAERRALASLGYLGGAGPAADGPPPADLPDVKDVLPLDIAVEEADKLRSEGDVGAAIERLRKIVHEMPGHTKANWALAWALSDQSHADEAMEILRSLLALKPGSRDGHYGLALMLLDHGQPAEAIDEFLKTIEIDPEFAEAHYNLAQAFYRIGEPAKALEHFGSTVEIDPGHAGAYQWRAHLLGRLGRIDEAIADCRQALKYAPSSPQAHHNLGAFLAAHGDLAEARERLSRAVELEPQNAQLQQSLGAFLVKQRDYAAAVGPLEKALELDPQNTDGSKLLAQARRALERETDKPPERPEPAPR